MGIATQYEGGLKFDGDQMYITTSGGTTLLTLGNTGSANFVGAITTPNLFLGDSSVRLSPGANGEVGINYNTSATGSLVWYAGGTASKFNVTNAGNATFAGNVTVSGTSSTFNTGGSGTFVTNDATSHPRITVSSSNAQLGLFRSTTGVGGMYIGASSSGFRIYTEDFTQRLLVDQSGNVTTGGNLTVTGNQYFNGEFIEGDGKEMFRYSDGWLRINEDNDFGSGIYCGTGILRTDGAFQIGGSGAKALITAAGAATFLGAVAASNFSGSSSGTNTGDQDLSSYLTSVAFSDLTSKPTTLSGYGIIDGASLGLNQVFTGDNEFEGDLLRTNQRISNNQEYPLGHYTPGETVFELNTTWSNRELRQYFGSDQVSWDEVANAPGGYAVYINGGVNVGGAYNSGFPYIPIDQDGIYYMEAWIKNAGTAQGHYMGSIDYEADFSAPASGSGNPGSYGYWVMSNYTGAANWTKVSGYITGHHNSDAGAFETDATYWTPQALFNYSAGTGTRACWISGWKVIRVDHVGDRTFQDKVTFKDDINFDTSAGTTNTHAKIVYGQSPSPDGSLNGLGAVANYGADGYGLLLHVGYGESDNGGIKITDDGIIVWGASDENVFTVIDEDSRTERFRIDNSGNITASGTLSANGYNNSNWDTAYGWGDHGLSAQDKTDIGNLSGTNTGDQTLASLGAASTSVATTSANGLMSSTDKTKLDAIESGADVTDAVNVSAAGGMLKAGSETSTAMKGFETNLSNQDDWQNSPVSILERDQIGTGGNGADKYAPNLNFHWRSRVSNSLWMNSGGILFYGSYGSTGVPAGADGTFKTGTLYAGTESITATKVGNWNTAYGWGDHGLSAQDKVDIGNLSGTNTGDQVLPTLSSLGALSTSGGTMTGTMKVTGSIIHEFSSAGGYVPFPKGAMYTTATNAHTGAIRIKTPVRSVYDMVKFVVEIFDYTSNESVTLNISGYINGGTNQWVNQTVVTIADSIAKDYKVRFGVSDDKATVYIGETNSTWSYPQVIVRDFYAGFNGDIDRYDDDWSIDFVTSFDSVEETYSDNLPASDWSRIKGKPSTFAPTIGTTSTTAMAGDTAIPSATDILTLLSTNNIVDWTTDQGSTNIHSGNYNNTQLSNAEVISAVVASSSIDDADKGTIRSNIGAGTSSLAIGTTSTTALAGNTSLFDGAYSSLSGTPTIPSGNAIIDWTADQGNTNIHSGNYSNTQLSQEEVLGMLTAGANITITTDGEISATDTDTVYTHPTTAGNKHIPSGGASGQFLRYSASGTASWATPSYTTNTDTTYSAGTGLDLTGTTFSIEPDLRDGVTRIGKDTSNYIAIGADTNVIDFHVGGVWVARMESDGDLHMKGDVIAFSDIFNP